MNNGIDFEADNGCPIRASHSGNVIVAGDDGGYGKCVRLLTTNKGDGLVSIYGHLKEVKVTIGDKVETGQVIGYADNTGNSTGPHLHFEIRETKDGQTINKGNGYNGAIDPAPLFKMYDPDWDKCTAYKRYGRRRTWQTYTRFEIPVVGTLTKALKRLPKIEEINACVYGGWSRESIQNPAMAINWKYLKKDEMEKGIRPFSL